jgi:hypothetical protein
MVNPALCPQEPLGPLPSGNVPVRGCLRTVFLRGTLFERECVLRWTRWYTDYPSQRHLLVPELRRFYEPVVALSFVTSPEHKLGLWIVDN